MLALLLLISGCSIKAANISGTYSSEDASTSDTFEVRSNGTFAKYVNGQKEQDGVWHSDKDFYGIQTIEFDFKSAAGEGVADEFHLVRRHGHLCWQTNGTGEQYFCKMGE
jgi:hypothetical protein